ncbi:MAG: ESPR domain-containing protein, partial [Betaproteobacteria bacterium]
MRPLNKIYRLVWSRRQGRLVVASEIAKSSRKGPKLKLSIGALILLTAVRAFAQVAPDELPTGGSVQAGSAAISTLGSQMTVQQATDQ